MVVAGPTASGKTRLGIELAKRYNGEIVSADSMQIYRGMDIGTAKASLAERSEIPHHLIDVAEPDENWSVSKFVEEATKVCDALIARGKLPVIVGGTGLYIDSLLSGREFADTQEDKALRTALSEEYDRVGGGKMLEKLRAFDPERAEKLAPTDKRRILRAIEIFSLTGKTITQHDAETKALPPRYDAAYIVLNYKERADLYERIEKRVDKMLDEGLFGEVKRLLDGGLSPDSTAMQAIGYKEFSAAVRGEEPLETAVEEVKLRSRQYAKRQVTWFKKKINALWWEWGKIPDFSACLQASTAFVRANGIG